MENKLFELVARRRSVRRYTNEHIDDAVIEEIMKVALTAPASFGHQPVEFVVVRDKRAMKEIADVRVSEAVKSSVPMLLLSQW